MKIQTTIEKISGAISRIQRISSKNISLPILENVLLIANNNNLLLRTTNLHVGVEITIPVKVEIEGTVAVNLSIFSNIISNINSKKNINFNLEENILKINTDDSSMNLKTCSYEDFPTLPQQKEENYFTIPVDKFSEGISSVIYSASQSDIKPEISSVYIYSDNGKLVFVSTDSYRLAEKSIEVLGIEDFPGVIVPVKNIQEFLRVFSGDKGEIKLYIDKNQISIISSNIYFTSRIVDGNYPDYKQVIPKDFNTEAIVLREDIIQTLKLINVFSNTFNRVSLNVLSKDGKISIISRNTEIGENSSLVDAAITGDDVENHINHKYLSDMFNSTNVDSLSFSFTEKNKPFIVKGVGDDSFLYLIMPTTKNI